MSGIDSDGTLKTLRISQQLRNLTSALWSVGFENDQGVLTTGGGDGSGDDDDSAESESEPDGA